MGNIDAYELSRLYVEVIADLAEEQGLNHSQLAKIAFGDSQSSIVRWRKIRSSSGASKPQSLTVEDSILLADALGMDFSSLAFRVSETYKMRAKMNKQGNRQSA
ncbi:MAG: hypothetical protein ACNI27_07300 [Desulfovibrio sp.]